MRSALIVDDPDRDSDPPGIDHQQHVHHRWDGDLVARFKRIAEPNG
jgi:hypothetical protein